MSSSPTAPETHDRSWRERLVEAEAACRDSLSRPPLAALGAVLPENLTQPEGCFSAVANLNGDRETADFLRPFASLAAEPHSFERWLLLQASLFAIPRI